nr:MAG TPA: hypothetical protein [Caudoviricetes sp.]DAY92930.1 MAG TPA: hypothetical protein [Caudoviricetes sp.]
MQNCFLFILLYKLIFELWRFIIIFFLACYLFRL